MSDLPSNPKSDPSPADSRALLQWLVDAGADEAISETPTDHFAAPATSKRPARSVAPSASTIEAAKAVSLSTGPGSARALAASCNTLSELRTALENFEGSELKRLAKNTVFADGAADARIMFIGEAPGRDEDAQGVPFVGRAGKLLDRMLEPIGLDRSKVYITNVLPWRPPQNRDPSGEEVAICLPFLHRHIELLDPRLLVLLGAVATRHLLGSTEGIMRLRGRWDVYQAMSGETMRAIPVMPTLHPAYLLRQPAAKRLAWRDLLAIAERAEQLGLA